MTLSPIKDLGGFDSPLLVFGGPYSNLQATEAMLAKAVDLGIDHDHIICTGDVVAYGSQPEDTIQLVRDTGIHVVMGNCEESLADNLDDCGCGFEEGMVCAALSEDWFAFARTRVSDPSRQWMASLPRMLRFELGGRRCVVIHGSIERINEFVFASSDCASKTQQLEQAHADVIIGGHCGIPFGQALERGAWLNAGVVGLPANDGTRDGWYLVLEPRKPGIRANWQRLSYDHAHCYQSMLAAGQTGYADCIESGLWPSMDVLPTAERRQQGNALHLPALDI